LISCCIVIIKNSEGRDCAASGCAKIIKNGKSWKLLIFKPPFSPLLSGNTFREGYCCCWYYGLVVYIIYGRGKACLLSLAILDSGRGLILEGNWGRQG